MTPEQKLEAAALIREDWVNLGVQIDLLGERRAQRLADAERFEREAAQERSDSGTA